MTRKLILIVSTAWSLAIAGGCGNSAGLVPVSGKVLYKGEPASGAVRLPAGCRPDRSASLSACAASASR